MPFCHFLKFTRADSRSILCFAHAWKIGMPFAMSSYSGRYFAPRFLTHLAYFLCHGLALLMAAFTFRPLCIFT